MSLSLAILLSARARADAINMYTWRAREIIENVRSISFLPRWVCVRTYMMRVVAGITGENVGLVSGLFAGSVAE